MKTGMEARCAAVEAEGFNHKVNVCFLAGC